MLKNALFLTYVCYLDARVAGMTNKKPATRTGFRVAGLRVTLGRAVGIPRTKCPLIARLIRTRLISPKLSVVGFA